MSKFLYTLLIFILGVLVGWLNPIEGPLDWTYDDYASQPAHKSPVRAAPKQEVKEIPLIEENEESLILYNINNFLVQQEESDD